MERLLRESARAVGSMNKARLKGFLAVALFCAGLAIFAAGVYLETRNPRSGQEDVFAWEVLAAGVFLIGVGASLPFLPSWLAVAIGLASPFVAFESAVIVYWTIIILIAFFRFL
jgi:hypothetical protein